MTRDRATKRHTRKEASVPPRKAAAPPRPDPATLDIVIWPDPVLTRPAEEVGTIDSWLLQVVERMKQLMESHEGVGLAAPQVGLPLRLFVMAEKAKADQAVTVINPVLELDSHTEAAEEGCLSLPGIRGQVIRAKSVTLTGYDLKGDPISMPLEGFPARIAQHENDHLDGVLILSRMPPSARIALGKKLRELRTRS